MSWPFTFGGDSNPTMGNQPSEQTDQSKRASGSAASVLDLPESGTQASAQRSGQFNEDRETLVELLRQMVLIRRFEEKCAESYSLGKIGGFCHLYIGQEAVGVGAISALREDDYVLTSYREHGQAIAKGISPDAVMAELYGKAGGCSRGKGGSMHLFDNRINFMGGHAIVGGQIPLATGVAFAAKYQETDRVTLCFFGEAAVNQGAFHESLNMAQLWKLPCIYICENNMYGMGTSLERAMSL
ncbi:MAG TPA: thiamine pyrophosphate-dependent enzyme, partial [Pyrinomonadaceae bacterium]|nr:thiamine pyrophosphate-dependent enzyme [Pyrinomonadaceae bacterium]